jgi:hypothetical protein
MNANDGQTGWFVFNMPTPQLRDDIATVNSAIGPKLDQITRPFRASMVSGLLLIQGSPTISGAGLPIVMAAALMGMSQNVPKTSANA